MAPRYPPRTLDIATHTQHGRTLESDGPLAAQLFAVGASCGCALHRAADPCASETGETSVCGRAGALSGGCSQRARAAQDGMAAPPQHHHTGFLCTRTHPPPRPTWEGMRILSPQSYLAHSQGSYNED